MNAYQSLKKQGGIFMGFKKLSQQELESNISSSDELIAIINGELKKINVETLVRLLNKNFDVDVEVDTASEYRLRVNIGDTSIVTPNLVTNSVVSAEIIEGHLIFTMTDESTIDLGVIVSDYPQYGVCYDEITQNPTLTRVGASSGLVAGVAVGDDTSVVNDFDNIYPWSEMKRCTVADNGTITSYEGEPGYIEDGSIGQVMVEIPKFYIKRVTDKSNNKVYTYICKAKLAGYRTPEAFKDRNGNELSHIYIGAYPSLYINGNDLTNSIAYNDFGGKKANYANTMLYAKNRGEGWHNLDIREICDAIQPLFIVEFATLDSSSIFSGCADFDYFDIGIDFELTPTDSAINTFYTRDYEGDDKTVFVNQEIDICIVEYEGDPEHQLEGDDYRYFDEDYQENVYVTRRKITHIEKSEGDTEEDNYWSITFSGSPLQFTPDGDTWINETIYNGVTNCIKASSGIIGDGNKGYVPFKWRGFENLFNNDYTWVGGILYNTSTYGNDFRFNPDLTRQELTTLSEFEDTGIKVPDSGYISKLADSVEYPYLALPVETHGTSDTAYCDEFTNSGKATRGLRWGHAGLFGFTHFNYASGWLAYSRF